MEIFLMCLVLLASGDGGQVSHSGEPVTNEQLMAEMASMSEGIIALAWSFLIIFGLGFFLLIWRIRSQVSAVREMFFAAQILQAHHDGKEDLEQELKKLKQDTL